MPRAWRSTEATLILQYCNTFASTSWSNWWKYQKEFPAAIFLWPQKLWPRRFFVSNTSSKYCNIDLKDFFGEGYSVPVDLFNRHISHNCPLVALHCFQANVCNLQKNHEANQMKFKKTKTANLQTNILHTNNKQ